MDICSFRNFIEKHDLNCLELQWANNRKCEFLFVTSKENTMFRVVYDNDKNGALSFSRADIQHGTIDYFMDEATMESMLFYHQLNGIHHYRGNNIVPFPESEAKDK